MFVLCCLDSPLGHRASNIYEIIRDHAEPNPAFHSIIAFVPATIETMSSLDHADASLASGSPFLPVAEPTLLLLAFALGAFGGAIGDANALDALRFGGLFVFVGVEGGVGGYQVRGASQLNLMGFDRRKEQI